MGNLARWEPVIAVPTKKEAVRLPDLVESLAAQTWLAAAAAPPKAVIVVNNSIDRSAEILASNGAALSKADDPDHQYRVPT